MTHMPYCGDKIYILTKDGDIKAGILSTAYFGLEDSEDHAIKIGISYPHPDGTFDYEEIDSTTLALRGYATLERAQEFQRMLAEDAGAREELQAMENFATFMQNLRGVANSLSEMTKNIDPDELAEALAALSSDEAEFEYYDEDEESEEDE